MNGQRRILNLVKVIALSLIVVSVSIIAYAAVYSEQFSRFSPTPYSTASYNTTTYYPGNNYSLYLTADNCEIHVLPSPDNSLRATLEVSNSFFQKAFANIEVTERTGVFTFDIITPQWFGTSAVAYVYIPVATKSGTVSAVTQNGGISVDAPANTGNVVLETTNGNIELSGGVLSDVTVQTTNGNLYITMSGFRDVVANSVNGNVEAHISSNVSTGSLSLTTTNGNLALFVNSASNLSISASTVNGQVSLQNLTYTASQFTLKQFVGTVNGGGATINLTTVNGSIRLTGT